MKRLKKQLHYNVMNIFLLLFWGAITFSCAYSTYFPPFEKLVLMLISGGFLTIVTQYKLLEEKIK